MSYELVREEVFALYRITWLFADLQGDAEVWLGFKYVI